MSCQIYVCDECGKFVGIGDWPFCPHGTDIHGLHSFRAYIEHGLTERPVEITSLAQRRRLMKAANADYRTPGVGMPGCEF